MLDEATGELTERWLDHESGEAQAFYRHLQGPVRVGIRMVAGRRINTALFALLLSHLRVRLWCFKYVLDKAN